MQPRLLHEPLRLAGASLLRLQSDARLVALARDGHDPAFAAIVDRYRAPLVRYCSRLLGPERAEDAVQQALINAHTSMNDTDRDIQLRPWLYRIAHNVSLNTLRGARDTAALGDDRADPVAVEDVVAQRQQLREALQAISSLPQPQRDALLLRELEGRSHEEIAAALGVSVGGARQHLYRARTAVRSAVTAITPYPLLVRLMDLVTSSAAETGAGRASEVAIGTGLGAAATKVGVGVIAAGALVTGAVRGDHLIHHHHHSHKARPAATAQAVRRHVTGHAAPVVAAAAAAAVATPATAAVASAGTAAGAVRGSRDAGGSGSGHHRHHHHHHEHAGHHAAATGGSGSGGGGGASSNGSGGGPGPSSFAGAGPSAGGSGEGGHGGHSGDGGSGDGGHSGDSGSGHGSGSGSGSGSSGHHSPTAGGGGSPSSGDSSPDGGDGGGPSQSQQQPAPTGSLPSGGDGQPSGDGSGDSSGDGAPSGSDGGDGHHSGGGDGSSGGSGGSGSGDTSPGGD